MHARVAASMPDYPFSDSFTKPSEKSRMGACDGSLTGLRNGILVSVYRLNPRLERRPHPFSDSFRAKFVEFSRYCRVHNYWAVTTTVYHAGSYCVRTGNSGAVCLRPILAHSQRYGTPEAARMETKATT
jgi:hypothetical protein